MTPVVKHSRTRCAGSLRSAAPRMRAAQSSKPGHVPEPEPDQCELGERIDERGTGEGQAGGAQVLRRTGVGPGVLLHHPEGE